MIGINSVLISEVCEHTFQLYKCWIKLQVQLPAIQKFDILHQDNSGTGSRYSQCFLLQHRNESLVYFVATVSILFLQISTPTWVNLERFSYSKTNTSLNYRPANWPASRGCSKQWLPFSSKYFDSLHVFVFTSNQCQSLALAYLGKGGNCNSQLKCHCGSVRFMLSYIVHGEYLKVQK